jgi:hypothetical protein
MIFERTFAYAGENLSEIWTGIAILPGWHGGHSDTRPFWGCLIVIACRAAHDISRLNHIVVQSY